MSSPLKAFALAPLACLCLSANAVNKDKLIVIGPLLDGEALRFQLRLYKANYPADWRAFLDLRVDNLPTLPTGFAQQTIGDLPEEEGYGYFSAYLPSSFVKAGGIVGVELGICEEYYYRGIDHAKLPFYFQRDFKVKTGSHVFQVDEEGLFETQNEVYHLDEARPGGDPFGHDAYDVRGLCLGNDIGGRKVPLSSMHVDYYGFYARPLDGVSAHLRILNYREDFEGIASDEGAYSTLPLKVTFSPIDEGGYRYSFALEESYYYSQVDLRASRTKNANEPSFRSNALFLPLREGHDEGKYRFQVVLENAGAFGDTLILNNEAYSSRSFFGNCLESEYCVVVGGD